MGNICRTATERKTRAPTDDLRNGNNGARFYTERPGGVYVCVCKRGVEKLAREQRRPVEFESNKPRENQARGGDAEKFCSKRARAF